MEKPTRVALAEAIREAPPLPPYTDRCVYLGRKEYYDLVDDPRVFQGHLEVLPGGGVKYRGMRVYQVDTDSHFAVI